MELYINEVAVASQMSNHKNVLKLWGCCLETQVPTLVYEFAANGCLSNHIFAANGCLSDHIFEEELSPSKKNSQLLSWESKLRIATEIADAVAYLHKGTSKMGNFATTAPESAYTGRYTEKSDVYSFGVILCVDMNMEERPSMMEAAKSKEDRKVPTMILYHLTSSGSHPSDISNQCLLVKCHRLPSLVPAILQWSATECIEAIGVLLVKPNPHAVYEFAANGCLSDHICEEELSPSNKNPKLLSWENQHYVAKLYEFGLSISIPLEQTHVDVNVVGNFGTNAPESAFTRRFTEKSDVYSFGVVLFEILIGKRVLNTEDIRVYLTTNIVKGNTEQLMACAELAIRCVKMNPEERPPMIETAKELTRIRII
ncbi:hypothetical protein HHK36_022304 [Tetracentron sinense]|uniref:Protein kinase domain-containing protein n=1 Tax=Tetracentron sinense TaxID=13715 RepID=A0A834YMR7_TETSI|nr:hypothetical protein HHK36_022304 [Tetracentron sinense]